MKMTFITMVICPKVRGMSMLSTQGILEMGEVPRPALHDRAIPMLMDNMPKRNMHILSYIW